MQIPQGCFGLPKGPEVPNIGCRYYASSSGSFGSGSEGIIAFDTPFPGVTDTGNFIRYAGVGNGSFVGTFPNTQVQFVIPYRGVYAITYAAEYTSFSSGANQLELRMYVNGVLWRRRLNSPSGVNIQGNTITEPGLWCEPNTVIQFTVIQASGSTLSIRNAKEETYVTFQKTA